MYSNFVKWQIIMTATIAFLIGWLMDFLFGDPQRLPHPVVWFGKAICFGEQHLNTGANKVAKGASLAIILIVCAYACTKMLMFFLPSWLVVPVVVFYCLAGTTLIREVREVFRATDRSVEEGRTQVARIVGRDTTNLSAQEVRTAALETLAENLSDGVIAPLFWFALLGAPGMVAYKMVNTLDSMIGYRNEKYRDFGRWAAKIDDAANYIPARITALLMIAVAPRNSARTKVELIEFVRENGRRHASPNSGYPEAALAGILDCRFGGPHEYFGEMVEKPYIGTNDRQLTNADVTDAICVNRGAEILAVVIIAASLILFN